MTLLLFLKKTVGWQIEGEEKFEASGPHQAGLHHILAAHALGHLVSLKRGFICIILGKYHLAEKHRNQQPASAVLKNGPSGDPSCEFAHPANYERNPLLQTIGKGCFLACSLRSLGVYETSTLDCFRCFLSHKKKIGEQKKWSCTLDPPQPSPFKAPISPVKTYTHLLRLSDAVAIPKVNKGEVIHVLGRLRRLRCSNVAFLVPGGPVILLMDGRNPAITSWYSKYSNVLYIHPQVVVWDFFHQQYYQPITTAWFFSGNPWKIPIHLHQVCRAGAHLRLHFWLTCTYRFLTHLYLQNLKNWLSYTYKGGVGWGC